LAAWLHSYFGKNFEFFVCETDTSIMEMRFYSDVKCVRADLAFVSPHFPMSCRITEQSCSIVVVLVSFCGSTKKMAEVAFAVGPSGSIFESRFVRQLLPLLVEIYVRAKRGESEGGVGRCWVLAADLGFDRRPLWARPIALLPCAQLPPGHTVLVPCYVFLVGVAISLGTDCECNRLISPAGIPARPYNYILHWGWRMRRRLITLVVLGSFAVVAAQNTSTRRTREWLVRVDETELSMRPTAGPINVANCLVIAPYGRAHLELRRQEFFNGHATLATYEATLNAKQLDILQAILQRDEIRSLQQFVTPTTPMGVDSFHVVKANIYRPADTQEIGYFEWQGKPPENAASASENWSHTATAMEPLVEWVHSLKSTFPWKQVSNPRKGVCGEP
jgi:hypothetical protein